MFQTLAKDNLDAARLKLMDMLCNYQGFTHCELICVFDAYKVKGGTGEVGMYHNIHVVYTKEAQTADAYIEKTSKELKKKNSKDVFNNKSKIGDIICPIFLIHGKRDQTIPIDHSYELAKSIHNIYKWYPKKGGHNNIVIDFRRKFYQKFRFYLDYLERMQNKHHQTSKMNLSGVLPSNGPIYKNLYGSTAMLQREENYLTSSLVNTDNKAKMMLSSSKENSESVQLDSQGNVDASKDKSFCTLKQDEYSNYLNYSEYTDRLSKDK